MALTRQIIQRMKTERQRTPLDRPATIGLLAVSDGVDVGALADALAAELRRIGSVAIVDAARIDADLASIGIARRDDGDVEARSAWRALDRSRRA